MSEIIVAIHQDIAIERLQHIVSEKSPTRLLIVTTHLPYPDEREHLMQIAPDVTLLTFADLLTDAEMAACDDEARQRGLLRIANGGRRHYSAFFMRMSRHLKNERVLKRLRDIQPASQFFHADGLGIDGDAWLAAGSAPLDEVPHVIPFSSIRGSIRRILGGEVHLLTGSEPTQRALLLGSIHRIPLAKGIRAKRICWPLEWGLTPVRLNATVLASMLRLKGITHFPPVFTALHQYNIGMGRIAAVCGQTLSIVADGHHPSNYPASYIEIFGDGEFVTANPLSARWFQHHGRRVMPGPWFQASPRFQCCDITSLRRVMLVLNHAGDWSALIERSDTDRLLLAFVEAARGFPDIEFVVRVHPTMATREHEGVGSIERICKLVRGMKLPNLVVSDRSLQEDLERGDLYLSEYSQVLIDSWQRGKLGAAINLTRRRSFMTDYERLGFHFIDSLDGLERLLRKIINDPTEAIAAQNHAVARFNRTLERWNVEGVIDIESVNSGGTS